MKQFLKSAFQEIEHVVWPTPQETKQYFIVVVTSIVVFGLFLFILGYIFSQTLFGVKDILDPQEINISNLEDFQISTDDITLGTGAQDSTGT